MAGEGGGLGVGVVEKGGGLGFDVGGGAVVAAEGMEGGGGVQWPNP